MEHPVGGSAFSGPLLWCEIGSRFIEWLMAFVAAFISWALSSPRLSPGYILFAIPGSAEGTLEVWRWLCTNILGTVSQRAWLIACFTCA